MINRHLRIVILVYLWVALVEDSGLFLVAWLLPEPFFRLINGVAPLSFETAILRRSAGQWAALALVQGITLARWKKDPVWLAVAAGARFSDLFTDLSYLLAAPSLTSFGYYYLFSPPILNLLGVMIMLRGYKDAWKQMASVSAAN